MSAVLDTIISILVMVLLGYFLKRIKLLEFSDVGKLNNLVIYVAMPAMIFMALYTSNIGFLPKLAVMPLLGITTGTITGILAFTVLTIAKFSKIKKWSTVITVTLGNTAFLGFPVIIGVLGQTGLIRAIFYDIASLLTFLSLSIILMINFGGELKEVIKKIIGFPTLWAVILGISLNFFSIPIGAVLTNVLTYIGQATIPLVMITLGLSLDFKSLTENIKIASFASFFKLVVSPIIGFFVALAIGLSGLEYHVAIIEAAMSSGMLNLVLAITYDLDVKLTSNCLFITILFSFITLPIILTIV
ncbi:AEC family transporter [Methanobrevibacter filiformis]|uniref:Putative transporter YfdV n=1 Tax=Methanobrevibacter filiformis TaxID=55758 RepID=A0A165ZU98_9EURY|nr:AEC family transporter [Methanobrevibacter filiformis]KZX11172.1 putative transporter YfdV [Methanobrevibacter filiformis]